MKIGWYAARPAFWRVEKACHVLQQMNLLFPTDDVELLNDYNRELSEGVQTKAMSYSNPRKEQPVTTIYDLPPDAVRSPHPSPFGLVVQLRSQRLSSRSS